MKRLVLAVAALVAACAACGPNSPAGGGDGGGDDDDGRDVDGGGTGGDAGASVSTGLEGGWTFTYGNGRLAPVVATDPNGNIYFASGFTGAIQLGATHLDSAGGTDIFVAKIAPGGEVLWVKRFGGASEDVLGSMDASADGVAIVGYFTDAVGFGGATLRCTSVPSPCREPFVLRLDSSGRHLWSRDATTVSPNGASWMSVDLDPVTGRIAATGYFWDSIDLGTGAITGRNGVHAVTAVYDADGTLRWSRGVLGSEPGSNVHGIDVAFAGNRVVALLTAWQTVTVQGGPTVPSMGGGGEAFVLSLSVDSGATTWMSRISTGGSAGARAIAAVEEDVAIAAEVTESATVGSLTLPPIGDRDVLLYRLGATGNVAWARRFGGLDQTQPLALSATDAGSLIVSGQLDGEAHFGTSTLTGARFHDAFLVDVDGATGDARVLDAITGEGDDRTSDAIGMGDDVIIGGVIDRWTDVFGEYIGPLSFIAKRTRQYE